ncbi:aminoglycoside phosphotransferase family protein [Nonomuraea rubra]|uniref:aminoglycoside phosphotransferase family protein n=1 Tax=Nonomuraea rubra TaxID=46180 RepID=UPI0033F6262D
MIPEAFARATVEREGEPGAAWLAGLPAIVAGLLERWECVPGGEVLHGGVGVVVPVRRATGDDAVIKVSFPHPGNVHEPDAFAAWGGRGAVRLYERADERFAMLLERVRPATLAETGDVEEMVTVAGRLSLRLAIPAPPGLPRLREQAGEWEEELRKDAGELPHALPARVVDAAVATARELGPVQPDLLLHGDLHPRNVLRADREPWLAVDPKGYAGDPAYDGGTLLKSLAPGLAEAGDLRAAVHRVLAGFAAAAGLDRERVRRWAQFHAVRGAFWGHRHGFRLARGGAPLDRLTELAEHLAELLTDPVQVQVQVQVPVKEPARGQGV